MTEVDDSAVPAGTEGGVTLRNTAASRTSPALLSAQKEAFQAAIDGASLADALGILVRAAIAHCDAEMRCAFYMADPTGSELQHVTGMPEPYALCVDGFKIGSDSLACGLAVHNGSPVITADVRTEPRWRPWLWLAEQFGYRAVWSFPVETTGGKVVGTFAMYRSRPAEASREDLVFASGLTQAAAIIISRHQQSERRAQAEQSLRDSEARQRVLISELQHRTRNIIAVVKAMADKTIARSSDLPDFRQRFGDRLGSLARVQGLLSRLEQWDRVTFDKLLKVELDAVGGDERRIVLDGPTDVALRSSTVQTFALALHELVTNAVKYGALGEPGGHLFVSWRKKSEDDGQPWLHVEWRETGVVMPPGDGKPKGSGSGRELIERALSYQLRAKTTFAMEEDGVRCTIALPVSRHQAA